MDQDGIPTFVEVKRCSDTRARRLVVAQMLDYAANAITYWRAEELRDSFNASHLSDPERVLKDFLGSEADLEAFWKLVRANLQQGRVRLLFVADLIHPELRRLVEFLNEQMDPAEVLALELRRHEGEGIHEGENIRTITPVVYGRTTRAMGRKNGWDGRFWTVDEVLEKIGAEFGTGAKDAATKIVNRLSARSPLITGKGRKSASIRGRFTFNGKPFAPFAVWSSGWLEIGLKPMTDVGLLDSARKAEFLGRLGQIENFISPASSYPVVKLMSITEDAVLGGALHAIDWVAEHTDKHG